MPCEFSLTLESSADARARRAVRLCIIAFLFAIFKVENLFHYPWAV